MTDNPNSRPLRVLQLTDPHLMADPKGDLLGVNTRASLAAVIDQVLAHHGRPDLILATGDLAQDASEDAYRYFGDALAQFGCPSLWIAGNHDDTSVLSAIAAEYQAGSRSRVQGGWHFVMLDSSVHGKVYGGFEDQELAFLDQALSEHPDLPTMVCLHHHPVDIGCDWMANIGLRNPAPFWQVLDRHHQVRVVLWGHIHQELAQQRNGVALLATPSTCIQFARGSSRFAVEPLAPGYRWLRLQPDGTLQTGVSRLADFTFEPDYSANNY